MGASADPPPPLAEMEGMTPGPSPQHQDNQDGGCFSAAAALRHYNLPSRGPRAGASPGPHPT